jgi:hypothetical protein
MCTLSPRTHNRYDADGEEAETLTIPSTSKRPLGIGSSESKEAQEIKLQEQTVSQEAKEQRVSLEESEEKEQRVSQEDTVSHDSTFEELHFRYVVSLWVCVCDSIHSACSVVMRMVTGHRFLYCRQLELHLLIC